MFPICLHTHFNVVNTLLKGRRRCWADVDTNKKNISLNLKKKCKNLFHIIQRQKNNWTRKIPKRKNLDPRNNHEKKFLTHEIPTRKSFGPTKLLWEKLLGPRNTKEKKIFEAWSTQMKTFGTLEKPMKARWPKRPRMAREQRNLAHSFL